MAEESQAPPSIRLGAETGEHDDGLSAFAGVRPRLFGIAYRMLGSAAEARRRAGRLVAVAIYQSKRG